MSATNIIHFIPETAEPMVKCDVVSGAALCDVSGVVACEEVDDTR